MLSERRNILRPGRPRPVRKKDGRLPAVDVVRCQPAMHHVFEHTADLGLAIEAASLPALLAEAGEGLFEIIAGDLAQIRPATADRFSVPGTDPTWLLFDWVAELHAAFELRRMLYRSFEVSVDAAGLAATARGEPYDPAVHTLAHEIKAITQHELLVRHIPQGWQATLIVDI
jgi:SHS2 domain-containing protein